MDEKNNINKMGSNPYPEKPNKGKFNLTGIIIVAIAVGMLVYGFLNILGGSESKEIRYDQFISMLNKHEVKSVSVKGDKLEIKPKSQDNRKELFQRKKIYYTNRFEDGSELTKRLEKAGVRFEYNPPSHLGDTIMTLLGIFLPMIFFGGVIYYMLKKQGGGPLSIGKNQKRVYIQKETGVRFKDVAGVEEAKESLEEVVDFLHNPHSYTEIGAKLPKGALLVGPPGTGKTLLAKAVAGEANVPFFSISGSEFVEMFVGVGASRVRELFAQAQKAAPCIVFIDEIDAIGKSRDNRMGGNDEREQTLNQLLSEMDGFDTSKGLLVLAATNRPEILDPALLRPGRFDRQIIVDRPDLRGRIAILKVHGNDVALDDTVDFKQIALITAGAVGSDLANMINEAAILAVKNGRKSVNQGDLEEAVEIVLMGKEKKDRVLSKKEKDIVAYHEVGHALIGALQNDSEPVQKITIIPRTKGALGYVMQAPKEEKFLSTKNELLADLCVCLGGRAAEEIIFGDVTTGASNDIEQATKIARDMITRYGMSEKFGLMGLATVENQYLSNRSVLECGDSTATEVDKEVMDLLHKSYEKAKALLNENITALHLIAKYLLKEEMITGKEFMRILHCVLEYKGELDNKEDPVEFIQRLLLEDDEKLKGQEEIKEKEDIIETLETNE